MGTLGLGNSCLISCRYFSYCRQRKYFYKTNIERAKDERSQAMIWEDWGFGKDFRSWWETIRWWEAISVFEFGRSVEKPSLKFKARAFWNLRLARTSSDRWAALIWSSGSSARTFISSPICEAFVSFPPVLFVVRRSSKGTDCSQHSANSDMLQAISYICRNLQNCSRSMVKSQKHKLVESEPIFAKSQHNLPTLICPLIVAVQTLTHL